MPARTGGGQHGRRRARPPDPGNIGAPMATPSTRKRGLARVYTIYVIELSRDCVKEPCALAPLYVGQTAHDPEHRFAQHKAGGTLAAGKPYRHGVRLRWDLMMRIPPLSTRKAAEAAERHVAQALERRGHRVFWG